MKPERQRLASTLPVNKAVNAEPITTPAMQAPLDHTSYPPLVGPVITDTERGNLLSFWYARGTYAGDHGKERKTCPLPEIGLSEFGLQCRKAWLDGLAEGQHRTLSNKTP